MIGSIFEGMRYHFNPLVIPPALTGVAILGLGVAVMLRERSTWVSRLFFLETFPVTIWLLAFSGMYCAASESAALWWAKMAYLGVPFIPAAAYHFTVTVVRRVPQSRVWIRLLWGLAVGFSAAILGTDALIHRVTWYWWGPYPRYGWLSGPYLAFFFGTMAMTLREYWVAYRRAPPGTVHQRRMRTLLIGFSIVMSGSVDYLAKFGVPVYPFGYVPVAVFLVTVSRAIWRYHLVDLTPSFAAGQILVTMNDPLIVCDADGVIRVINPAACAVFGYTRHELLGRPLDFLEARGPVPGGRLRAAQQRGDVRGEEMVWMTKTGRSVTVSVSISPLRHPERGAAGAVIIARDMREYKRAEERLRRANEELRLANQQLQAAQLQLIHAAKMESIGRLAAGVAHEVKNPLAILVMGLEYLRRRMTTGGAPAAGDGSAPDGDGLGGVLQEMGQAVRRADAVIKGLLDFSVPRRLDLSPTPLNEVVDQALQLVKHVLETRHVAVTKRLAERLPLVSGDGPKLEQVFVNLFVNAADAMGDGGTLTVRTAMPSPPGGQGGRSFVTVEVDDTGPGIPPEHLAKVCDPFFTTKPPGQGTGLGLAVTKTIIEMHGGLLDIQNRPGGGVRVMIVLPAESKGR